MLGVELTGSLVRLRPPRPEDGPAIVANVADPAVARYLGTWAWNPADKSRMRSSLLA